MITEIEFEASHNEVNKWVIAIPFNVSQNSVEQVDGSDLQYCTFRYKAVIGQRTGIIPSNYVEVISEPDDVSSKPAQVEAKATSPLAKEAPSNASYQTTVPTSPKFYQTAVPTSPDGEPDGERIDSKPVVNSCYFSSVN